MEKKWKEELQNDLDKIYITEKGKEKLIEHLKSDNIVNLRPEKKQMFSKTYKKVFLVASCCMLLMGAGSSLMREFKGGIVFEWSSQEKRGYGFSHNNIKDEIFVENENGLYYIFDGANIEISAYCSDDSYFIAPVLDENGTGYVVVVGGVKGERGFLLKHFELGDFFVGQGENEIYGEEVSLNPVSLSGEVASSYPQLLWNHHATHFLGTTLNDKWFGDNLSDILENDYGIAKKIYDNFYYVECSELDFYTATEKERYINSEMMYCFDWINSIYSNAKDDKCVIISIDADWTETRENEVIKKLNEIGFNYELTF